MLFRSTNGPASPRPRPLIGQRQRPRLRLAEPQRAGAAVDSRLGAARLSPQTAPLPQPAPGLSLVSGSVPCSDWLSRSARERPLPAGSEPPDCPLRQRRCRSPGPGPQHGSAAAAAVRRSCPGRTETEPRHDASGAEDSSAGAGREGERHRDREKHLRGHNPPPCAVRGWEWGWDLDMGLGLKMWDWDVRICMDTGRDMGKSDI